MLYTPIHESTPEAGHPELLPSEVLRGEALCEYYFRGAGPRWTAGALCTYCMITDIIYPMHYDISRYMMLDCPVL